MSRWLHSELQFPIRRPEKQHLSATEERWEKTVIRGHGSTAFHLSPADCIPGRHCEATSHARARARAHIETSVLCSMQTGHWAFLFFLPLPPQFVTTAGDWKLVVCTHKPEQAWSSPVKQTNKKINKQKQMTKWAKKLMSPARRDSVRSYSWREATAACVQIVCAHTQYTGGIIWWHRCVKRVKTRCLPYLPLSSRAQSESSGRPDPCSCVCPHRWCTSSPSRWPRRGGWNWADL